jgi:hypothetical protein
LNTYKEKKKISETKYSYRIDIYNVVSNQNIIEKEKRKIARENSYALTIEGDTEEFCLALFDDLFLCLTIAIRYS